MEIMLQYPNKEIVGDEAHKGFYVFGRNQHESKLASELLTIQCTRIQAPRR